ncbi:beta-glucuronidase [Streptococcus acidominimus]|uniref:Beta-glucuronidase n=1 Tax=Streptococcus acidominimus TaxID=1326 RepID=A0A239XA99_STRAI|nr:beta-glucuronidase [Streptococcus acidominimus]SNV43376.1 beta-glucuronidase [Streptococcus acidominimus]
MGEMITLELEKLDKIRDINPRLVSYNVEFAEVTGGTFWKSYSEEQIAGTEDFYVEPSDEGIAAMYKDLMQEYDPIDLSNEKLRYLTKELGEAWVRVSGTWSTKTYYDFDGETAGVAPQGYLNVLTKEQWLGVLDFVKAVGGHLKISMANCPGLHTAEEPWHPSEAEKIFALSQSCGVPIEAVEFANEPNILEDTGFPKGYTAAHYRRDQDLFFQWLDENYPDCLKVGPSSTGGDDIVFGDPSQQKGIGGIEQVAHETVNCEDLLEGTKVPLDVFSYHYYNGVSERLASVMPAGHWSVEAALSETYLAVASNFCKTYLPLRDRFIPGAEMWVTESGDAGGGGNTWASTYLDVPRTLNELGTFACLTNGVIFHNTLASSDYGYLAREVFDPRPNYFAVLLWNRLMGSEVFDSQIPIHEGAHVFVHSRKDGQDGKAILVINNSETKATTLALEKDAQVYRLSGKDGDKRAKEMCLNGKVLNLDEDNKLPNLEAELISAGELVIAPTECVFVIV